ncbi:MULTISPECIES: YHS domain-containing (seleno)protein [Legionella]|uniref:YHS domain protein n=1 Tax=Legionella resiliens TaxID=2905958 RepID=A0ABS8X4A7_9GAMM|nr:MULTISPECIES: YHS domain-containing (seleno)protein [unclassified Legionella]MCE0724459.1 YHS domain protein [Legionella sp. 9fVS26]MCE3533611.1 YHS domain protein [Legionella sp. 8cVS16]QLZ69801.1 YHS domain-containing protein [Legionella sp. PC1000]
MNVSPLRFLSSFFLFVLFPLSLIAATNSSISLVGDQGYDLVSYQQKSGPVRGSGNHVVFHHGVAYIFASKENKKTFAANPEKYLPAYGGYCAYGVAAGHKVISDPLAWKLVNGKLYLNLNKEIQNIWAKDSAGNIKKADEQWLKIKDKDPSI